jgi:hypothetical protein
MCGGESVSTTKTSQLKLRRSQPVVVPHPLQGAFDARFVVLIAFAVIATILAFQSPPAVNVAVGSFGDRLFLQSGMGLGTQDDALWYGDELNPEAQSGRSRWTRQVVSVHFPAFTTSSDVSVMVRMAGWPNDVIGQSVDQPQVEFYINGQYSDVFTPTAVFDDYYLVYPAGQSTDDITIELRVSDVFTSTTNYVDLRPKGVRVERIALATPSDWIGWNTPPLYVLAYVVLITAFLFMHVQLIVKRVPFALFISLIWLVIAAILLSFTRIYTVLLMPWLLLELALVVTWLVRADIAQYLVRLMRRFRQGAALGYGLWVVATIVITWALMRIELPILQDVPIVRALVWWVVVVLLTLIGVFKPVAPVVEWLQKHWQKRGSWWFGVTALGIAMISGYVIITAPFIGHADYADNAVVARNLVYGRGWVVDYVTQFYQIYDQVTRPQETWPLLQPVWIAAAFIIAGISDSSARIPNVVFLIALLGLTYHIGRKLWDSRVGVYAAIVVGFNIFVFRQLIFATTDLAFMLFHLGSLYAVWRMREPIAPQPFPSRWDSMLVRAIIAGVWTGLMLLQKPGSGGITAIGLGLWLLYEYRSSIHTGLTSPWQRVRSALTELVKRVWPIGVWAVIALLIVSPYVERNMRLFGSPAYTTEQYDAWILEYTQWDAIYRVYAADGGIGTGDIPERSWLLRWGFDGVFAKVTKQFVAVRDYMIPSLPGFPGGLDQIGAPDAALGMVPTLVMWFAVIGILAWQSVKHRLIRRVLVAAFVPYLLFMVLYWHANEPRYWVAWIPWFGLFAGAGLIALFDRMRGWYQQRMALPALALVFIVTAFSVLPAIEYAQQRRVVDAQLVAADQDMYRYLRANTPLSAVMMTRVPWQLNWYAERPAVMIPADADAETFLRLAKHYRVQYLVLDSLQRPNASTRAMIAQMIENPAYGFVEVYRTPEYPVTDDGRSFTMQSVVYEFNPDAIGVAAIR